MSEHRKSFVRTTLASNGYPWHSAPKQFTPITLDKLKSSADLKTPDGPISDELRRQLVDSGWEHLQEPAA